MPQPTITRNDQNSTGTFGIVLAAAALISPLLACAGSLITRFNSSA